MKRLALPLLGLICTALALLLAALWIHPDGRLRNTRWQPPTPITADYKQMLPLLHEPAPTSSSQFLALLERPLFSETRRPPPPPPPPNPVAPPPDTLSTAQLVAVFDSAQVVSVILRIQDKNRRVRLHEAVDGWVLRSVHSHGATFEHSGQVRQLSLQRAKVGEAVRGTPLGSTPVPR